MRSKRWLVLVLLVGGVGSGLICSAGRPAVLAQQARPHRTASKGTVPLAIGQQLAQSSTIPTKDDNPKLEFRLNRLKAALTANGAAGLGAVAGSSAVTLQDGAVRVIVEAREGRAADVASLATSIGMPVEGTYKNLVQLLAPVGMLDVLTRGDEVGYVRLPWEQIPLDVVSEGVGVINADDWHASGLTGAGVKVGILDLGFDGYSALLGSELPASVTPHSCRADVDITAQKLPESTRKHGTAVAEIVHDVAPGAQLFLANSRTEVEFAACVDWLTAQGVRVINFSAGIFASGPGDGAGPYDSKVSDAASHGILWVNAAGNQAQKHWLGLWSDPNANGFLNFAGTDETFKIIALAGETVDIALKWHDPFGGSCNNYDAYLYDSTVTVRLVSSENPQDSCTSGLNRDPFERLSYTSLFGGTYYVAVRKVQADGLATFDLYATGDGPDGGPDCLNGGLEYCVKSGSILEPADSPDALTVGAVAWNAPNTIETYSSRGPTYDGRTKPDIVAPDCVTTVSSSPSFPPFCGTSGSAPYVGGAAALVMQAHPEWSGADVRSFLTSGALHLGTSGTNNIYGAGRLDLGAPKGPSPTTTQTSTPTTTRTPTDTATPGSSDTPVPPTDTPVPTNTPTLTSTPEIPTPTTIAPSATPTAIDTATNTPTFTFTPTFTNTPTRTATPTPAGVRGDGNCDGRTNSLDALAVLQLSAGLIGSLPCGGAVDVNRDGRINPLDAALILQLDAGIIHALPA